MHFPDVVSVYIIVSTEGTKLNDVTTLLGRLAMSFSVVCPEERERGPTLVWSSSLNLRCCSLMNQPLDWMPTLQYLWYNFLNGQCSLLVMQPCLVSIVFYSLSIKGNNIVVMSIHQPRYSIFKLLDTLTLLSLGDIVYHGRADQALTYFSGAGDMISDINALSTVQ